MILMCLMISLKLIYKMIVYEKSINKQQDGKKPIFIVLRPPTNFV